MPVKEGKHIHPTHLFFTALSLISGSSFTLRITASYQQIAPEAGPFFSITSHNLDSRKL